MAKFIPDNALFYLEQRNAKSAIDIFRNSTLGKNFDAIEFSKTAREIGLSENISTNVEILQNNYYQAFDNDIVNTLLGKRFGVAFFTPDGDIRSYSIKQYLQENTLIIADPQQNADLLTFLTEQYIKTRTDILLQTIQYGNHHISRLTTLQGTVSFSVIEGLMIASFNENLLKQSIDAYDGELQTIFDVASFKTGQKRFDKPERFFYLPVESIHSVATYFYDHVDRQYIPIIQEQLDNAKGFTGVFYGAWNHEEIVHDKIIFSYNEGYTNDVVKGLLATSPSSNTMMELTTSDPLVYYWSNTIDLNHFLSYLPSERDQENAVTHYIDKLEGLSQKTVEEILSMLGQEVSLVVEKSDADYFIPVPLGAAFFRINPDVDLSEMVNYIVDAFDVPVIEKIYDSVTYLYWVASPQDGLQPLCGYWSNLFFIGNSAQLIERVIDGYNKNTSLLNNPKVKSIDPGITGANNSITYFNNSEILDLSERLLSALATITTLEDKSKAQKARVIIHEVIIPLFEGLKEYDRSCTKSYFEPGMVVIDSRTSIARKTTPHEAK